MTSGSTMTVSKHPTHSKTTRGIAVRAKSPRKGSVAAARKSDKPAMLSKPLVAQFFDPKGFVIVDRVADRFGMSKQQFAETIGVKPETVYRATRASAPKTQARATEMLEIVGRIAGWAGGEKQAMAWYRAEPIAAFGGRTAESLVKEGKAAAVRDYLDHIATGGFA
jgi:ribosome-binding protein aMBF1 (putative translation factor)